MCAYAYSARKAGAPFEARACSMPALVQEGFIASGRYTYISKCNRVQPRPHCAHLYLFYVPIH